MSYAEGDSSSKQASDKYFARLMHFTFKPRAGFFCLLHTFVMRAPVQSVWRTQQTCSSRAVATSTQSNLVNGLIETMLHVTLSF